MGMAELRGTAPTGEERESRIARLESIMAAQATGGPAAAPAAAPAPTASAPAAPAVPGAEDDGLEELAIARAAPEVDPRVAWREAAIRKLVDSGGMPERLARVTVNQGKRAEIEGLLSRLQVVGSEVPPQGQAPSASLRTPAGTEADEVEAPPAAPAEGRRGSGSGEAGDEVSRLRQQVAALEARVHGDARAQARTAFAAAAAELSGVFPRIRSDGGQLEPAVAEVARSLMRLPAYAQADERTVLHAAAAAVFSTGPGSSGVPAAPTPHTPSVPMQAESSRPMTKLERADLIMQVRARYGDPMNLSPQKDALARAEVERLLPRRS